MLFTRIKHAGEPSCSRPLFEQKPAILNWIAGFLLLVEVLMSQGLGMKVSWLVEIMLSGIGQRGADDLKYHWFETIYGLIREQPWPWNWHVERSRTYAPILSVETYTWVAGNDFAQASALPTFDFNSTGRVVEIDNLPYELKFIDITTNRLHFVEPLVTTQTTPVILTLYRSNKTFKTSNIETVEVDGTRVRSSTADHWRKFGGQQHVGWSGAKPCAYEVKEEKFIPAPLYPPSLNGASAGGNIGAGAYRYFFTTEDPESGRTSRPGPEFLHTHAAGVQQSFGYGRPAPGVNLLESTSYQLTLWRSKVGATGERYPAYRVGTKIPYDVASFVLDNLSDQQLIGEVRYYDGPQVDVMWHSWPDAIYSVYVRHVDNYGGRPDPLDRVSLGKNNIVTELLPMGASKFVELANRDVNSQHQAIIKFRQQLAYLLKTSSAANNADPGLEETNINDGIPDNVNPYDPTTSYTFNY